MFVPPPVLLTKEIKEICKVNDLPFYFKSWEQTRYLLRLSQCKITRRYTIP
jgi:hypothetical protein